jgi:hypothetical protein
MPSSGWFDDPLGRHEKRFFNGMVWTSEVQDGDMRSVDVISSVESPRAHLPDGTVLAPQRVVVAAQQPGDAPAVAALTLGIVGAVLAFSAPFGWVLGVICGVLALILGTVGLVKASGGASHSGLAVSGVVLGLIASVVAIHTASDYYRVVHAVDQQLAAQASIPVVDVDPVADHVHVSRCYEIADGTRNPVALGTVVNESGHRRSLKVTVAFRLRQITVYGYGITGPVDQGEQTSFFARAGGSMFTPSSCVPARPPHPIP